MLVATGGSDQPGGPCLFPSTSDLRLLNAQLPRNEADACAAARIELPDRLQHRLQRNRTARSVQPFTLNEGLAAAMVRVCQRRLSLRVAPYAQGEAPPAPTEIFGTDFDAGRL